MINLMVGEHSLAIAPFAQTVLELRPLSVQMYSIREKRRQGTPLAPSHCQESEKALISLRRTALSKYTIWQLPIPVNTHFYRALKSVS